MLFLRTHITLQARAMIPRLYSGRPWLKPGLLTGLWLWLAWARLVLLESQSRERPGQSRGLQAKPGHAHH